MPIYDFQCSSCGYRAELMRKMSEPTLMPCPQCSKETFAKMLSAPSFQLNGSGWYASDFKDKKPKNSDKKTDGKTDSKIETTESKKPETETKSATCNPGCACH